MKKIKLPIDNFRKDIIDSVNSSPVTIIVAETGAGKSTRVPQMLHAEGYDVVITQPRRLAAKSVARRVANELGCQLGSKVGFRTAVDRADSRDTEILFVTDGLQLVRELTSKKQISGNMCLIMDEVHEWNKNIETLVAWSNKLMKEGVNIKLVLMSATLDAESLSKYFNGANIINVPGRCFPVTGSVTHHDGLDHVDEGSIVEKVKFFAQSGENTLVFLPGKGEIAKMQEILERSELGGCVILPLHGDLDPKDQDLIFRSYGKGKVILSTNIAQTSVTIPDITAVVDSGLERRIILRNGVETLTIGTISKADVKQRAGRAGRAQAGQYVLCNDTDYAEFPEYPVPEILRTRLDQTVLRLAAAGLDATELDFFHDPSHEVLVEAKETLIALGALDSDGKITRLGRKINRFPTSVVTAKIILEAVKRNCLSPIVTIAAIMATNYSSLKRRPRKDDPDHYVSWRNFLDEDKEYKSDLLRELDLYSAVRKMKGKKNLAAFGIAPKEYFRTADNRRQIVDALKSLGIRLSTNNTNANDEEAILKSIASGMVGHIYKRDSYSEYESVHGNCRQLDRESVINNIGSKWIVGNPKNIQFRNRNNKFITLELVSMCSAVDETWFSDIAPHLLKVESGLSPYVDSESEIVISTTKTFFSGFLVSEEKVEDLDHERAQELLVDFFERKEKRRIENAFSEANSQYGYTNWISKPDEVTPYFNSILSKVHVTDDKNGEKIYGFIGLYSDSDPDFKILVYKTLEEAKEVTERAVKRLFAKSTKEIRRTPEQFSGDENSQLRSMFKEMVKILFESVEVSIENFQETKKSFVSAVEDVISNITEIFAEKTEQLQKIEGDFNEKLNSFSHDFVSSEISEIKSEFLTFKSNFFNLNGQAGDVSERIFVKMDEICELAANRKYEEAEKQAQKKALLEEWEAFDSDVQAIFNGENGFDASYSEKEDLQGIINAFNRAISNYVFEDAKNKIGNIKKLVESLKPEIKKVSLENLAELWGARIKKS